MIETKTNREAFLDYQNKIVKYRLSYSDTLSFQIGYWLNTQGVKKYELLSLVTDKKIKYQEDLLIKDYNPDLLSFAGYTENAGETYRTVYKVNGQEAYDRVRANLSYVTHVFATLGRTDLQDLLADGYYQEIDSIVLLDTFNNLTAEDISYFMK